MTERHGELLEEYMRTKRIKPTVVAPLLEVSRGTIYLWFTKAELSPKILDKLKSTIGFTVQSSVNNGVQIKPRSENIQDEQTSLKIQIEVLRERLRAKDELLQSKEDILKVKDQIIEMLRGKPQDPAPVVPFEIRDLIDSKTMKQIEKFLGDNIYHSSVCISDKFGKIEYVNQEFTNQTGYTIADIRGKSAKDLLQRDDADKTVIKKMREAILKRTYFEGEVLNYSKQGEPIICKLIIAAIKINGIEKLISLAVFSKVNILKYN